MKNRPIDRVVMYLKSKKYSETQVQNEAGLSNGYFHNMKKHGGSIGADKLNLILKIFPKLNAEWVMTGEGEIEKKGEEEGNMVNEQIEMYNYEMTKLRELRSIILSDVIKEISEIKDVIEELNKEVSKLKKSCHT